MSKSTLYTFVKKNYPKFFTLAVDRLCQIDIERALKQGCTILMPDDALMDALTARISDDEEQSDADDVAALLNALIFNKPYKTIQEISNDRNHFVNSLNKRVAILGATSTKVDLKCGGMILPNELYLTDKVASNPKFALWTLSKKLIPLDLEEYVKETETPQDKDPQGDLRGANYIRTKICATAESQYFAECEVASRDPRYVMREVYLEHVASLVCYLSKIKTNRNLLLTRVLPMLSFDKTDLYILIQPYRTSNHLIPTRILVNWFNAYKRPDMVAYADLVGKLLTAESNNLWNANHLMAFNIVEKKRLQFKTHKMVPKNILKNICNLYTSLFKDAILPAELMEYYKTPEDKLYEDEFRYNLFHRFEKFERSKLSMSGFQAVLGFISTYMGPATYRPMMTKPFEADLSSQDHVRQIQCFMNSTMVFYVLPSEKILKEYPVKTTLRFQTGPCESVYSISHILRSRFDAYIEDLKMQQPEPSQAEGGSGQSKKMYKMLTEKYNDYELTLLLKELYENGWIDNPNKVSAK